MRLIADNEDDENRWRWRRGVYVGDIVAELKLISLSKAADLKNERIAISVSRMADDDWGA